MSEIKLKPCPCGGEGKLKMFPMKAFGFWKVPQYYVQCKVCRIQGARSPYREKAIEAWNRRDGEQ